MAERADGLTDWGPWAGLLLFRTSSCLFAFFCDFGLASERHFNPRLGLSPPAMYPLCFLFWTPQSTPPTKLQTATVLRCCLMFMQHQHSLRLLCLPSLLPCSLSPPSLSLCVLRPSPPSLFRPSSQLNPCPTRWRPSHFGPGRLDYSNDRRAVDSCPLGLPVAVAVSVALFFI